MPNEWEAQLAQALRAADFDRANRLARQYGESARAALQAAESGAREAIYREAVQSLDNHLHLARVLRAHLATEWRANSGTILYQSSDSERHLWQLEG